MPFPTEYGVPDTSITGPAFTGEWRDTTGVQYHRARYLSPELGSWLSIDPFEGMIDEPITLNGYIYAGGDPVNNIDSSGMLFWSFPPGRGSRFNTLYDPGQYVARGQRYAHTWIERWLEEKNGFWETHLEFPGTGRRIDAIVFEQTASHINPSPVYFTAPVVGNVFEIEPADVSAIILGYIEVGVKTGFLRAGHGNPYCLSNQCSLPKRDRWNPERPMTWGANPYVSSYSQAPYDWRQVQWQFGNSISNQALNNGRGPEKVDPNALGAAGIPDAYWILLSVPGLILYETESRLRDLGIVLSAAAIGRHLMDQYNRAQRSNPQLPVPAPLPAYPTTTSSVNAEAIVIGGVIIAGLCIAILTPWPDEWLIIGSVAAQSAR